MKNYNEINEKIVKKYHQECRIPRFDADKICAFAECAFNNTTTYESRDALKSLLYNGFTFGETRAFWSEFEEMTGHDMQFLVDKILTVVVEEGLDTFDIDSLVDDYFDLVVSDCHNLAIGDYLVDTLSETIKKYIEKTDDVLDLSEVEFSVCQELFVDHPFGFEFLQYLMNNSSELGTILEELR